MQVYYKAKLKLMQMQNESMLTTKFKKTHKITQI